MSTLPNGPQKVFTAQEVDAWLLAAQERLVHVHLQAAYPGNPFARLEAFTEMSALLQEAFEEVRVVSEATRDWSQGVRGESANLQKHTTQLRERGAALLARLAQFAPPPPEATQDAERRLLALFKEGQGQRQPSPAPPVPRAVQDVTARVARRQPPGTPPRRLRAE